MSIMTILEQFQFETLNQPSMRVIREKAHSAILAEFDKLLGEEEPKFGGTYADVYLTMGRNMLRRELKSKLREL